MSAENDETVVSIGSTRTSIIVDEDTLKNEHSDAVRRLIRKLDRRLIPFLVLLELSSFINRISMGMWYSFFFLILTKLADLLKIGHAKLDDIAEDLHLSTGEDNWAISLFFLAYVSMLNLLH
jgi:hypothetical protein